MVNKLLWKMPVFLHELILKCSGYRLVLFWGNDTESYYWTNSWQSESFRPEAAKVVK